jgi:hypothetical protein
MYKGWRNGDRIHGFRTTGLFPFYAGPVQSTQLRELELSWCAQSAAAAQPRTQQRASMLRHCADEHARGMLQQHMHVSVQWG